MRPRCTRCAGWSGTCTTGRNSGWSGSGWTSRPPSGGWTTTPYAPGPCWTRPSHQSQDALAEIRTLSRGIAPPILAEQGLPPPSRPWPPAARSPTSVDVDPVELSEAAQNAAYFVVAEALANVEKHSRARHASVEVRSVGALAVINVDRRRRRRRLAGQGPRLAGLADRLAGVDGTLTVSSPAGGPTRLTATIPQHLGC